MYEARLMFAVDLCDDGSFLKNLAIKCKEAANGVFGRHLMEGAEMIGYFCGSLVYTKLYLQKQTKENYEDRVTVGTTEQPSK